MRSILSIFIVFYSSSLFASRIVYQPVSGKGCKDGLLLTTSSKVIGSKYKLGSIQARRYETFGPGKLVEYFDKNVRMTQSRYANPACSNPSVLNRISGCSQIQIQKGVIRARYIESTGGDRNPDPYDDYGITGYPIVKAYQIMISKGMLKFQYSYTAIENNFRVNDSFWKRLRSDPKTTTCLYKIRR